MVISNFYIISVIVYPFKDNSPLVINSYAPKSFKVSRHFFKPIAKCNMTFNGPEDSRLGQFNDNDMIYLRLRCSF